MGEAKAIPVPLVNPNETEARLAALHVSDGQAVAQGQPICTWETTKATQETVAEVAGYVVGLRAGVGDLMRAGDTLCWLAASPDWRPRPEALAESAPKLAPGDRITLPAQDLIQKEGIEPGVFRQGRFVTESVVREYLARTRGQPAKASRESDDVSLVVYGAGGHGKSVVELVRAAGKFQLVGILDDGVQPRTPILGLEVLGGGEQLDGLVDRGIVLAANAVGGVGDLSSRERVFRRILDAGMACPSLIHPTAFLEASATLSDGVQVFPHAYVGSEASLGFGVIVNTAAVVSHDCRIGDHSNIAPGALLAGGVKVGERVLIGMGVTVNLNVRIGSGARVGNSAVVKADVPDGAVVRAGAIWP